jgi:hypothetical protein
VKIFKQQSLIELAPICEIGSYAAYASRAIIGDRMHAVHGSTLHQQKRFKNSSLSRASISMAQDNHMNLFFSLSTSAQGAVITIRNNNVAVLV